MVEVEIRARVKNLSAIKGNALKMGGTITGAEKQIDKVYGRAKDLDGDNKLIEGKFSARIRQVNNTVKVEMKEIRRTGHGLEFSSPVPRIEDGIYLLENLDFEEAFTVSKTRDTIELDNFLICLDKVDSLGDFIEIEHRANDGENIEIAVEECRQLLRKLEPDAIEEKKKYGDLMQELINEQAN